MNLTLKIWRQNGPDDRGAMHEYQVKGISEGSSFLEMLDILKNRSPLIRIAVRESAVSAASSSMALLTARRSRPPASSI